MRVQSPFRVRRVIKCRLQACPEQGPRDEGVALTTVGSVEASEPDSGSDGSD
jgi:hypothetical protein